jgi:hypothetical protein
VLSELAVESDCNTFPAYVLEKLRSYEPEMSHRNVRDALIEWFSTSCVDFWWVFQGPV